jgi:LTXXQ motif family protein
MRRALLPKLIFIAALAASCAILTPAPARSSGLGGLFGLVTAPLRILGQGGGHRHASRHHRAEPAHRLAAPAATAAPAAGAAVSAASPAAPEPRAEPVQTEGRVEPSRPVARSQPAQPATLWPAAAPSAYEDLLGYALWSNDYADRFWTHGYVDIVSAMLAPAAAAPSANGGEAARGMCGARAKELAEKPLARVEQTLALTQAQQAALQDLRAALDQAIDRGKSICDGPLNTAAERYETVVRALWSMRDAAVFVRGPLDKFYESLSDEQKAQLGGSAKSAASSAPPDGLARACMGQRATDWPAARIEQAIRPNEEQRASLQALQAQLSELAQFLMTSCPRDVPPTPLAKLDAASDRVNAILFTLMSMDPAFVNFYSSLSDQQKKRFDSQL